VEFTVGRRTGKQVAGRALRTIGHSAHCAFCGTRLARHATVPNFGMKPILLALVISSVLLFVSFAGAQAPDANQEQKLLALVKEVQAQQTQMAENEKKIEEKLTALNETIRSARIYTKREK
jgi:hypothetical protein